jgi:hypothetical protein
MIRTLKALLLAVMAVTALGAIWASAAQAHTPALFHCEVEPCTITGTKHGTGKSAHHVFDVPGNGSITCNEITFDATLAEKTTTTITATGVAYHGCTFLGQAATVNMNGCDYTLHASTQVSIQCPLKNEITFEAAGCQVHIPPQGPLNAVHYSTFKPGTVDEITVAPLVTNINGTATGGCPAAGAFTTGEYTTGSVIATGETDTVTPTMVNITWTATVA